MATWAKFKFFDNTMLGSPGSTTQATTTESDDDHDVDYIYSRREDLNWQANDTTTPMYITFDGVGTTYDADYLAIIGHNFNTIGATIVLQYSTDNFSGDINDAFTAYAPSSDTVQLKEFTAPGVKRYWRLKITGSLSAVPFIAIGIWGLTIELDYASTSFDPNSQDSKETTNLSQNGFDMGTHIMYTERRLTINFNDADDALYQKVLTWWEANDRQKFFVAWETANNPDDVWLMKGSATFNNPFTETSTFRNITINLTGRKE